MDEIIELLTEIRDYLAGIDDKLSDINGNGIYSLEDLADKLDKVDKSIETLSDNIG